MSKESALKFDDDKPPMHFLDGNFLKEMALVLKFGEKKYGTWNFKKGHPYSKLTSAAMRHVVEFNEGEDLDKESGLTHLAHAACDLMMLYYNLKHKQENDDRFYGDKDR